MKLHPRAPRARSEVTAKREGGKESRMDKDLSFLLPRGKYWHRCLSPHHRCFFLDPQCLFSDTIMLLFGSSPLSPVAIHLSCISGRRSTDEVHWSWPSGSSIVCCNPSRSSQPLTNRIPLMLWWCGSFYWIRTQTCRYICALFPPSWHVTDLSLQLLYLVTPEFLGNIPDIWWHRYSVPDSSFT